MQRLTHFFALFGLIIVLWSGYILTARPVTLAIGAQTFQVRTHHHTVETMLAAMNITPVAEDVITPALDAPLPPEQSVTIQLARPVVIEADGHSFQVLTQESRLDAVLAEAGIPLNARDEVWLDGVRMPHTAALPAGDIVPLASRFARITQTPRQAMLTQRPDKVRLSVHRSTAVRFNDNGVRVTFYTTQATVGEALLAQGITLYLGDTVMPPLGTALKPGMQIFIERSTPVTLYADGRTIKTRTRYQTVGEVLAQEEILLIGQDYTRPALDHAILPDDRIEVIRVREVIDISEEFISSETFWVPDPDLEIDQQVVQQPGAQGIIRTRARLRYENNRLVSRVVEDEWLEQEPSDRIVAYGTDIVVRTMTTDSGGVIEYWRKIRMLVTPYTAATSGKNPDHPAYGITRTGLQARYGIAAVDPRVIHLLSEIYVPGYGIATAADTGGLILGKHVDLAFNEDQPIPDIYGWYDVYLLTPVPPRDTIRYVLPEWPQHSQ